MGYTNDGGDSLLSGEPDGTGDTAATDEGDATTAVPSGDAPAQPSSDTPDAPAPGTLSWLDPLDLGSTGGAIAAEVVLADGVPARGAIASLKREGGSTQGFADGDGRLFVRGLAAGTYRVAIGFPGYPTAMRDSVTVTDGRVSSLGVINLGASGSADGPVPSYAIRVVSRDGKKPIKGARVVFTTIRPYGIYLTMGTEGRPGELSFEGVTDEEGNARFEGIRPGTYDVLALADDFAMGAKQNVRVGRRTNARHTFELPKGLAISGTIKRADGTPAVGAQVMGLNLSQGFKSYPMVAADAEGNFHMSSLDGGNYMVMGFEDGHGIAQKTEVRPPTEGLELTLAKAATISGIVVDKETGEPVPVFTVRPYVGSQPMNYIYSIAYEKNDPEGKFTLTVDAGGPYTIEIRAAGYANLDLQGVAAKLDTVSPVKAELTPIGIVAGVVRGPDGAPVTGAEVYIRKGGFTPSAHKTLYAMSGPEGEFRIEGLPIRPTNLVVTHPEYSSGEITGVTPTAEGTPAEVKLGAGGAVSVLVTDTAGQPVAGVSVNLMVQGDFMNVRSDSSGEDGRVRFEPVSAGTYTVSSGNIAANQGSQFKQAVVQPGQTAEVELGGVKPAGFAVTGSLLQDGAPVADATVQIFSQGGDRGRANSTAKTAADGTFSLKDVPPGRYDVFVDHGSARASVEVEVLDTGPPAPVTLELRGAGVSGVIQDAAGKPLNTCWVTLEKVTTEGANNVLQNYEGQDWTGEDGKFSITGLADGTYRLRAFHMMGGHAAGLVDPIEVSGEIGPENLVVTLGAPRQITGRVTDVNGVPIEGANIRLVDSKGRDFAMINFVNSGSDGGYTYGGLRPDLYLVYAEAKGYAPGLLQVDLANAVSQAAEFKLVPGATLRIVVKDEAGQPVVNALIDLLNADGTYVTKGVSMVNILDGQPSTDAQGVGYWRDLAPGSYKVRVRPVGKQPAEANVGAIAGSESTVTVTITG
jgi:protocatechuate 3,4-dioxygenase beta subunit